MSASVTGIGWVTPNTMGWSREFKVIESSDGRLPKLTSRMLFGKTSVHFGRLDQYSKLGFAAITFALRDAGLEKWSEKRPIGIIASSVYGCLTTDIEYYATVHSQERAFPSPNLFAYTLPNVYLGEVATMFGLTGQTFVLNEPVLSGISAIRMAVMSIETGDKNVMIAGICDQGRSAEFVCELENSPGALFVVLRKQDTTDVSSYGSITIGPNGTIFFNNSEIKELQTIKTMCVREH
ncbi:MAG TPA: beta-ketoacyl synthase N-terminal-like domain-containing protein [Syntrophorhabdaceae bacterium]|nr:beta-ketoacyl synthase N-terminal-like domain-containing protein [Syntrophorhabdaceae bacterium]